MPNEKNVYRCDEYFYRQLLNWDFSNLRPGEISDAKHFHGYVDIMCVFIVTKW